MPVDGRSRYGDAKSSFNGGYKIAAVKINDVAVTDYIIIDTRMQIRLPKALGCFGPICQNKH
jgi:hypothetical protein